MTCSWLRTVKSSLVPSLSSGPGYVTCHSNCLACTPRWRSEEHTSELQSQSNLVCRLLLEKKKKKLKNRSGVQTNEHKRHPKLVCCQLLENNSKYYIFERTNKLYVEPTAGRLLR